MEVLQVFDGFIENVTPELAEEAIRERMRRDPMSFRPALLLDAKVGYPQTQQAVINCYAARQLVHQQATHIEMIELKELLHRFVLAAAERESTMGDPCRLVEVQGNLRSIAAEARAFLKKGKEDHANG